MTSAISISRYMRVIRHTLDEKQSPEMDVREKIITMYYL